MSYSDSYDVLQNTFHSCSDNRCFDTVEIIDQPFKSHSYSILPGVDKYLCHKHSLMLNEDFSFYTDIGTIDNNVHIKDIFVKENQKFNYQIMQPKGIVKSKKVVFLFHGFNEKDWSKYLTWAKAICDGTQSTIILFPIAFHMQRAPRHWSNVREMYKLSENRKKKFTNILHSTLSNVAISMRLHSMPQRFIWSGLQTYYDVIQLIEDIKEDNNKYICKDFQFNIFAYSIGGFLAQILKLTNYKNYFDQTKVALFCSGATFNRLTPVSKFILDSEANVALYSYLVEHFDKMLERDNLLHHYIKEDHLEGEIFSAMLDYQKMRKFRESLLKRYEHQIYAISLTQDSVIPSFEIMNTLKGAYRDINIRVDEIDFDYNYIHENPFPIKTTFPAEVDKNFEKIFDKFNSFFNQNF